MEQVRRVELMPGVNLTTVHTTKFKSSQLGVTLLTPLERETASENALLPHVLRRGSRSCPDMRSLSAALDDLYGGSIEPLVTKKGETQCIGFAASFLDDAYALNGEDILDPAFRLLGELMLEPCLEDGCFVRAYVDSERDNLIDRIRGLVNDKRQYSMYRLGSEMCRDEAWGISRFGQEEQARAVSAESLWQQYQWLLHHAAVELYYCGSAESERVERAVRAAFSGLPVSAERVAPVCNVVCHAGAAPNVIEEEMDVTQGKLAMGFRTGGLTVTSPEYPALMMFCAVFGGTSMSKLFMNVREKLSLCYFASASLEKNKGLMLISSGIEFEKYGQAKTEILAQLEACRAGDITPDELEGARRILVTALNTTPDSQSRLADFWLGQSVAGVDWSPADLVCRLEQVTKEQVIDAAGRVELDTVYFLKGKEVSA